jgi:hypothetical protein
MPGALIQDSLHLSVGQELMKMICCALILHAHWQERTSHKPEPHVGEGVSAARQDMNAELPW